MKNLTLVVILFLASVLVLAGCSSGDINTDTQGADTGLVGQETAANTGATPNNAPATAGDKSLKDIFAAKLPKYTADYTITAEGSTQELTQAFDLPKYAVLMKTAEGESKTLYDGNTVTSCVKMDGQWQCFKIAVDKPQSEQLENDISEGNVVPVKVGACSVAGETGIKYEVTAEGSTSTACYTADGILLEMAAPSMTMKATKVVRSVDDSIFDVPADAQALPGMPSIPGQ